MAENLFKDSNPDCNVTPVPVVDFRFVEDCFITPTPPPLFECIQPAVPATPCIPCPELSATATLTTGFAGDEPGCVSAPKIVFTTTKTQEDPCTFELDLDIELPFPKIPCPEINVSSFGVSSRYVNEGGGGSCGGEEFECPGGNNSSFSISTRHIPGDCQTADQCIFDVALNIDVPIPVPPCPDVKSKSKQSVGYEDSPCVSCTSDTNTRNVNTFDDIDADFRREGAYASVTEVISAYTLQSDLKTWEPSEFSRKLRSINELSAISAEERGGTTFIISQPPNLYRAKTGGGWETINTPNIDYSVATLGDRDALDLSSSPADTIVFVAGDDAFWRKTNDGWENVTPPAADVTVEKTSELDDLTPEPGTVVGVQNPTNRYKQVAGAWVPDENAPEIVVYDEESLALIRQEERCPGLKVGVLKPTDRYKFAGGEWRPARCPDNDLAVLSRKTRPADCETPPQCILDVVSELTVPIPRPPCPEFNVENFRVTTSFTGDTLTTTDDEQNAEDDSCSGCATVVTAETYADAVALIAAADPPIPPNTGVKVTNPPQFYKLESDLQTWTPSEAATASFDTLDDFEAALAAGDVTAGTIATIEEPDTLFVLGANLQTVTPVRSGITPPPGRLINLRTLDSLKAVPFEVRFNGLYIRVLEPVSSVISQDGSTWISAADALVVNNELGLQRISPEDRVAGMVVRVLNPSERFKITENGLVPLPCPQNRLTITPTVKKTTDCNTPNTCEFAVDLEIDVPVPRTPCPIINVKDFSVSTRFTGGTGAPEDEEETCCEPEELIPITEVADAAELNALETEPGTYAKTLDDEKFWLQVLEQPRTLYPPTDTPVSWIETTDPNLGKCQNLFRVIPKHRPPEDCHDPGQCEFDIELKIDIPIPRPPCPTFTPVINTTVGFDDSPCIGCNAEITATDKTELDAIPAEERVPGTYAKITNTNSRFTLGEDLVTWTPASGGSGPPALTVPTEADLLTIPAGKRTAGMVVAVANPIDRYKVSDSGEWVAAPCAKNTFTIIDRSRPPENCEDPGECAFDFVIDILVPIPRTPCPEFNITDFGVNTRTIGPCGDPCEYDFVVPTYADLSSIPSHVLRVGLRVYTSKDEQIWKRQEDGTWKLVVENAKTCQNSFTISARKECSEVAATVKDTAARDELDIPDDVKLGQIVITLEPTKKAWRAGNGLTTARWTETKVPDECEDANKACQCFFDVELLISIPIPVPPCPKFNVKRFEVTSYYDRKDCCENEDVRTCDPDDTENDPDNCVSSYFKICGAESEDECNTDCIFDIELVIAVPIPPPFCPAFSTSVSVTAGYKKKNGETCFECPADRKVDDLTQITDPWPGMTVNVGQDGGRFRWQCSGNITIINGQVQQDCGWVNAPCASTFMIIPGGFANCKEQVCTFTMILDLVVEIPLPPCPEIKIRNKNFDTCSYDYPYFRFVIEKEDKEYCPEENDEEKPLCTFNIDLDLFIPCPLFTDAGITVIQDDDMPAGGGFAVNKTCEETGSDNEDVGPGVCNFLFSATVTIPKICKPIFAEDAEGLRTGVKPEDRLRIWYIKPGEMCPADVQFFRHCYRPMCRTVPGLFICVTGRNRLVVAQDCQDPCLYWYAKQTFICQEMPLHDPVEPTQRYGDPCTDTGCECVEPLPAAAKPAQKTSQNQIAAFSAAPDLFITETENGVVEQPGNNDGMVAYAGPVLREEAPAEDKGFRPFKRLELYSNENFPANRETPPTYKWQLEVDENCLKGGTVTIKSGSAPAPAAFSAPPAPAIDGGMETIDAPILADTGGGGGGGGGDLGTGKIWIANNKINLEITLYTKACSTTGGEGGGTGGGTGAFTALPETIPPAEPLPIDYSRTTKSAAPSTLISELISAIKTDPQLRAAIREIVNQPD